MRLPLFISVILSFATYCAASGQVLEDSVYIHFRQSKVNLDTTYMNNQAAFRHIRQVIASNHRPDSGMVLRDVRVAGAASPEGTVRFNEWLSRHRAACILDYMKTGMILPDSVTTHAYLGRDWRGLRAAVEADTRVPYRKDVLMTLDGIIAKCDSGGERESDGNLARLKRLHGGVPYAYLYSNVFPYLRQANVVLLFDRPFKKIPDVNEGLVTEQLLVATPEVYDIPAPASKPDKPFYMALKTNMIADALCLPELGVEFYLGKNISIVGNWMYGWWDNDHKHRYWRAYGGDLALRWWFGSAAHRKPLTGHHLGVYGGVVTYDFEFGGKGHMGGRPGHNLWDRCMHYCGIEYGYSLPIARRFNIDFTVGLGYMGGKYVTYRPAGVCYEWLSTKQKHWYGPTKLEVSLVWLIGHGNFNVKKQKGAKQ